MSGKYRGLKWFVLILMWEGKRGDIHRREEGPPGIFVSADSGGVRIRVARKCRC
jgi:hypothetical protein